MGHRFQRKERATTEKSESGRKWCQILKIIQTIFLICVGMFGSVSAFAVPSHFSVTIGSALLCRDQIDAIFFKDYMVTYFGAPNKVEGGAYWWNVSATLFGAQLDSIFVSTEDLSSTFIGAVFVDTPDVLRQKILNSTGVTHRITTNPERWISPTLSIILKYYSSATPSKMYCLK